MNDSTRSSKDSTARLPRVRPQDGDETRRSAPPPGGWHTPDEIGRGARIRTILVMIPLVLAFGALGARLYQIQVIEAPSWQRKGIAQRKGRVQLVAERGSIFAAEGQPLSHCLPRKIITADLKVLADDTQRRAAAEALAPLLDKSVDHLLERMDRDSRRLVYLARKVTPEVAEAIAELKLKGIGSEDQFLRHYPNGPLACHVVGWAGTDGGMEGLELRLDNMLKGVPGYREFEKDARRRPLSRGDGLSYTPNARLPRPGLSVTLTLRPDIQHLAEEELARVMKEFHPKGATALVMDIYTGEILAMASAPDFDPNAPADSNAAARRNRTVTDCYEPGSTFKTFIAAMALERKLFGRSQKIDCENGAWRRGYRTLHDAHAYGFLSFDETIIKSSNIGAAKIGIALGMDGVYETVTMFGFGERTGIDLPGEIRGIVRAKDVWTKDSLLSVPMGQEIAVTPVQLVSAYCAMLNGGVLLKPQVVRRIAGPQGEVLFEMRPTPVRRVIGPESSQAMRDILYQTMYAGTGRRAFCAEYAIGGKTGTAQKVIDGRYSHDKYVASFCGFAPAHQPRLVCLVAADEPDKAKGYYGGTVAAPAVKEILRRSLKALGVPPRTEKEQEDAKSAFRQRTGG